MGISDYIRDRVMTMVKEEIKIRLAKEQDYEAVNSLYYETYSLYHLNIPDSYKKMLKTTLRKGTFLNMIEDKNARVLIAETGYRVVGVLYALIEKFEEDEWSKSYNHVSIEELSVSKCSHSRGNGYKPYSIRLIKKN